MTILLTGATGYVGGRMLKVLEARGHEVRCLARNPANLAWRAGPGTRVVAGDVLNAPSLAAALDGIETAYYLVHSLGDARGFEERERAGANNFATAARVAGIGRIIYLGGLGEERADLSPHLRSRHEVGRIELAAQFAVQLHLRQEQQVAAIAFDIQEIHSRACC